MEKYTCLQELSFFFLQELISSFLQELFYCVRNMLVKYWTNICEQCIWENKERYAEKVTAVLRMYVVWH